MNIFLSAIFIFRGLILFLVAEIPDTFLPISQDSVNIFQNQNTGFKPVVLSTMNPIIGIIIVITRYLCCSEVSATSNKIRPQNMKMALKLSVDFDHMYIKGWIFLDPAV